MLWLALSGPVARKKANQGLFPDHCRAKKDSRFAGLARLPCAAIVQQSLTTLCGKGHPALLPKLVAGAQAWATLRSLRPFAIDPVRSNLPRTNPCFFAASSA